MTPRAKRQFLFGIVTQPNQDAHEQFASFIVPAGISRCSHSNKTLVKGWHRLA